MMLNEPSNAAELRAMYKLDPEERAARYRLGEWLAAEPGRTWDIYTSENDFQVALIPDRHGDPVRMISGEGPTLADAILTALENAETPRDDEPNGPDDVTREDFARDEWTR